MLNRFLQLTALTTILFLSLTWAAADTSSIPAPPPPEQSKLTAGWTERAYTYEVQHPYDLDLAQRYSFDDATDTHDLWVFITDKPHLPPPNRTTPRTEIAMERYSSGLHMFDADYYITPGTFACIMQLFRGDAGPGLMLMISPAGSLSERDLTKPLIQNLNSHWFNLKVIHDPSIRDGVTLYINDILCATFNERASKAYYFKCGVYARENSNRSEVFVHALREWTKEPATQPAQ